MEKYQEIAKITEKYLGGHLQKLALNYENPTLVHVELIYEDDSQFQLDYEVDVELKKEKIVFCKHVLTNPFEKTRLQRNKEFETALFAYLLNHKRA